MPRVPTAYTNAEWDGYFVLYTAHALLIGNELHDATNESISRNVGGD